ncbi:MAG: toll/interleukin-1 receptor domain-containing protein [Methanothrix sp.]|uniref:toll/interleukin-1 receptor domain-containing protein n=1 Tax=Methanothrix sp. TaxID=90426 RepID=UPI0025E7CAA9|nr:toll/interleukin-1 receptor domain-containing protein [Methanothrix sp.]MCQ8903616.1 toll/interleukin-1 receptor domain-containing protein [Methanothrix sp.]
MISKIYISHSQSDADLAGDLSSALYRICIESLTSQFRYQRGISRTGWASFGIRSSECFVPIVTSNSIFSRTVNMEIGFAKAVDHLIIPILEDGVELPFFIEDVVPITFSSGAFANAVADLIRIVRSLTRLEWLRVRCPICGEEMTQYLTPQENVDRAISENRYLETACSFCEAAISLDPRTFSPITD